MLSVKIGLVSSTVPFVNGGYRFIFEWLEQKLRENGHDVETVVIPSCEEPDHILQQMTAFRLLRLQDYFERVITFRPPSHVVQHPRKVVWFIHHFRVFYDLWDGPYRPFPDTTPWRALRDAIRAADTHALNEAHRVFSNSRVVSERLQRFNGIAAEVLYPPVLGPERFRCGAYGDEIVSVCRIEPHKRQHLLVEAMRHVRTPVRLRLYGASLSRQYSSELLALVERQGLAARVAIENRWITEAEKANALEHALASAYVPFHEDSYGYPTIEAAHARRATVTVSDSGGVPEFVSDGENGLVVPPDPEALAAAFDRLHADRALARRLGGAASDRVAALGIDWNTVMAKLLA